MIHWFWLLFLVLLFILITWFVASNCYRKQTRHLSRRLKEETEKLDVLTRRIYELKYWCGHEFPILDDTCTWLGKCPNDDGYFGTKYFREDLRNKYGPKEEQIISKDRVVEPKEYSLLSTTLVKKSFWRKLWKS